MAALRADLTPDGMIRLEGEIGAGLWVRRIIGAKAIRDGSWTMPASLDSCVELRKLNLKRIIRPMYPLEDFQWDAFN